MADLLIVEDDDDIRESLAELLREEGWTVDVTRNGREALDRIHAEPPRMILLDLMMPVMSGWEMMRALANTAHSTIPVLIVSATADAVPPGVLGILRKPINVRRLLGELHAQLD
jgi:DNA-binding response OmpR family regulator